MNTLKKPDSLQCSLRHRRRGGDGGNRPHGQKVVGAMPQSRPHRNFATSTLYTSKRCSKNYECVILYESQKGVLILA